MHPYGNTIFCSHILPPPT